MADDGFKMGYQWMQQERCPQCREKERFANQVRSCLSCGGRSNTCNPEGYDKDLYLVLLEHWSGCCQVTVQAALHVTVEAYLQYDGGFDFKCLRRVFGQNYYRDVQNKIGIAAMRCPMAYGNWSERVFDRPERFGKMKPRFPREKPGSRLESVAGQFRRYWMVMADRRYFRQHPTGITSLGVADVALIQQRFIGRCLS